MSLLTSLRTKRYDPAGVGCHESVFTNPDQRAARQFVEERNQIGVGQMDAAMRRGNGGDAAGTGGRI